jgi:hypothetical protein
MHRVLSRSAVNLAGGSSEVSGVLPNSNTTATDANTANTIVSRDAVNGDFNKLSAISVY